MLLGEHLIAFRDTSGRVGVMDHRCPHRCASLFLGRNEEDGLRCVYHGWKFDAAGNCVDMPNVPPQQDFKDKVRAKAYKVAERNGLVWVYMGERAEAPPLPVIEALAAAGERRCSHLCAARMQLAAGARGRHRHLAFRLSARRLGRSGRSRPRQFDPLDGRRIGRPNITSPRPIGARCTPPIAGRGGQRPIGALPISCFRSGRRRRRARSTTSAAAPGSRWTTPIRCSSASHGKACRHRALRSATAGCSPARS